MDYNLLNAGQSFSTSLIENSKLVKQLTYIEVVTSKEFGGK